MQTFTSTAPFVLESGAVLQELTIGYHTYGTLNPDKNNTVWICHALTANSAPDQWWPGMVGKGKLMDPSSYFIVCANILGSCYGTTGPLSMDPQTGHPYFHSFPLFTIRDMVKAHQLLATHLGIEFIHLMAGGSMGGYQAIEWCVMEPERIGRLFLIATAAKETPWGIAIHASQRLAIEADSSWLNPAPEAGLRGLKAARAMAILTYRNPEAFAKTQQETYPDKTDEFRAASYVSYQGEKLVNRFNAFSYWYLGKAMDTHNIARGRNATVSEILNRIQHKTLVIGIKGDLLFPLEEVRHLAEMLPGAEFHPIESAYGHDGFLIEHEVIASLLRQWLEK